MLANWRCVRCGADTGGTISAYCAVCLQTQTLTRLIERQSSGTSGISGVVIPANWNPKNPWHWVRDFLKLLVAIPLFSAGIVAVLFLCQVVLVTAGSIFNVFFG